MDLTADNGEWSSPIVLDPFVPNLAVDELPDDGLIGTGESQLLLVLDNIGRQATTPFIARLESGAWGVRVVEEAVNYGAIQPGHSGNPNRPFRVTGHDAAIPGMRVPMKLTFLYDNIVFDEADFVLQVGTPGRGDPTGPDAYGYYAFDNTDDSYDQRPGYQWIEISTYEGDADYEGDTLTITRGDEINGLGYVPLPFTFRYYGQEFDTITVSTNGFIAMGADTNAVPNLQNWSLEGGGSGGPYGMIAPFWDNLSRRGDRSNIFTYGDDNCFIIEWYRVVFRADINTYLRFQIILYDPAAMPTWTMDGAILFNYQAIMQRVGVGEDTPFASVGISNPDATTGISYTAANVYDISSAPLENGRQIFFTTTQHDMRGTLFGRIVDSDSHQTIRNAVVATYHGGETVTDENGNWRIEDAFAEVPFSITAYKRGYLDTVIDNVIIPENGELEIEITLEPTQATPEDSNKPPVRFDLQSIYPNPFNSMTTVKFSIDKPERITLSVYDLTGREVVKLFDGVKAIGNHNVVWNAVEAPAGLYLVQLEGADRTMTRKVVLLR